MIKKIIFSDLDGTLLNSEHKFSLFTKTIVKQIMEKNILFVVNTGRITENAITFSKKINCHKYDNGYVISNNGAQIYSHKENKLIYNKVMKKEHLEKIHNFLFNKREDIDIQYYSQSSIYVYQKQYESQFWAKLMHANYNVVKKFDDFNKFKKNPNDEVVRILLLFDESNTTIEKIKDIIKELNNIFPYLSIKKQTNYFYEIMPGKKISKGYALKYLTKKLNIDMANTISFGDSYNDISLIKFAGNGLAVKNGVPELKKISDEIVDDNVNNGPAMYLWKNFIKNEENIF